MSDDRLAMSDEASRPPELPGSHSRDTLRVAVVMPVLIRSESLWGMTLRALASVKLDRSWMVERRAYMSIHVVANGISVAPAESAPSEARRDAGGLLDAMNGIVGDAYLREVIDEGDLHVAGAWNRGIESALRRDADCILVMANDVVLRPGCVEAMTDFGLSEAGKSYALWSGVSTTDTPADSRTPGQVSEGADFSCFMLRATTVERFGWFDVNFRPAYFEDNDYHARVVMGGSHACRLSDASFDHVGSATVKDDAEQAHHVEHWFPANRSYFVRKWGREPAASEAEMLASYYKTPFNVPGRPVYWWARP